MEAPECGWAAQAAWSAGPVPGVPAACVTWCCWAAVHTPVSGGRSKGLYLLQAKVVTHEHSCFPHQPLKSLLEGRAELTEHLNSGLLFIPKEQRDRFRSARVGAWAEARVSPGVEQCPAAEERVFGVFGAPFHSHARWVGPPPATMADPSLTSCHPGPHPLSHSSGANAVGSTEPRQQRPSYQAKICELVPSARSGARGQAPLDRVQPLSMWWDRSSPSSRDAAASHREVSPLRCGRAPEPVCLFMAWPHWRVTGCGGLSPGQPPTRTVLTACLLPCCTLHAARVTTRTRGTQGVAQIKCECHGELRGLLDPMAPADPCCRPSLCVCLCPVVDKSPPHSTPAVDPK